MERGRSPCHLYNRIWNPVLFYIIMQQWLVILGLFFLSSSCLGTSAGDDGDIFFEEKIVVPPPTNNQNVNKLHSGKLSVEITQLSNALDSWMEISCVILLILYAFNYIYGRRKNDDIAETWYKSVETLFKEQFSQLGYYSNTQVGVQGVFIKDSDSSFKFYASGRRNCIGVLCTLELRKRQDLLSLFLACFDLSTMSDTLTIEIPLEHMDPLVFAVIPKRKATGMKRDWTDLKYFTEAFPLTSSKLDHLNILALSPTLEANLLDQRVIQMLSDLKQEFEAIHFTDQSPHEVLGSKKLLRFVFRLPSDVKGLGRVRELTGMALQFIDRMASFRLSSALRTKAEEQRRNRDLMLHKALLAKRKEDKQIQQVKPKARKPKGPKLKTMR